MKIPVATYGLCKGLARGDKFKIRKEANNISGRFKDGEEVEIVDFVGTNKSRVPGCMYVGARLLKFKGHEDPQYHPLWIINCNKCPFYNPGMIPRGDGGGGNSSRHYLFQQDLQQMEMDTFERK